LATNSIGTGANRKTLERIKETGNIFFAWSDRPWVLNGASVRVSMIGFDNNGEQQRTLDNNRVENITPDLKGDIDLSTAQTLYENEGIGLVGVSKKGPFDIDKDIAFQMMSASSNPHGRSNREV
jgi:hypothetical protein